MIFNKSSLFIIYYYFFLFLLFNTTPTTAANPAPANPNIPISPVWGLLGFWFILFLLVELFSSLFVLSVLVELSSPWFVSSEPVDPFPTWSVPLSVPGLLFSSVSNPLAKS